MQKTSQWQQERLHRRISCSDLFFLLPLNWTMQMTDIKNKKLLKQIFGLSFQEISWFEKDITEITMTRVYSQCSLCIYFCSGYCWVLKSTSKNSPPAQRDRKWYFWKIDFFFFGCFLSNTWEGEKTSQQFWKLLALNSLWTGKTLWDACFEYQHFKGDAPSPWGSTDGTLCPGSLVH